jgi:hypothetical protein
MTIVWRGPDKGVIPKANAALLFIEFTRAY